MMVRSVVAIVAAVCALTVTSAIASAATAKVTSGRAYVLSQRSQGSATRIVLAPTGLRFGFSAAVPTGRSHKRKLKPSVGVILRYRDKQLTLLDPTHHTYQPLALASAIHSYESELKVLAKAQPMLEVTSSEPVRTDAARAQQSPTAAPARLTPLRMFKRIGPVLARAYRLHQGSLNERIWYSSALPRPPKGVRSLLVQALSSSGSGPLDQALRAHASQIPLRIDERSGKKWRPVLRTLKIVRRRLTASLLARPHGYRRASLLTGGQPAPSTADRTDTVPASPQPCGALSIASSVICAVGQGPVAQQPQIWADYWGDGFRSHLDYVGAVNQGLENMVGDRFAEGPSKNFWGPLAQYGVGQGSFLGYSIINGNPPADVGGGGVVDSALGYADVVGFVLSHRFGSAAPDYWWRYTSATPIFAIFVDGSKVNSSGWDGYHAFAPTEGILFAFLVHPAMPFLIVKTPPLSEIGSPSLPLQTAVDETTEDASHEFVEAATDPYPFTSWADPLKEPISSDGELADICEIQPTAPWATDTRIGIVGTAGGTAVSTYWSDKDQACVPQNQPEVKLDAPVDGATYPWDSQVPFAVETNDPFTDGPVPSSNITWSDDVAGAGFEHGNNFSDTALAPGTHHISVTVRDSQGAETTVGPVTIHVAVEPPQVQIDTPADGTTFGSDQTISFRGEVFDPVQGDIGPQATWSVDGTPVGTGAALLQHKITTVGTHTITLTADNGGGAAGTASASIKVNIVPGTGAPSVSITTPADDIDVTDPTTPITFTASATTASGMTIPDADIKWSDDLDGPLGTGHTITTTLTGSICEIDAHHVTVTATDPGNGQSSSDEITVRDGDIC